MKKCIIYILNSVVSFYVVTPPLYSPISTATTDLGTTKKKDKIIIQFIKSSEKQEKVAKDNTYSSS